MPWQQNRRRSLRRSVWGPLRLQVRHPFTATRRRRVPAPHRWRRKFMQRSRQSRAALFLMCSLLCLAAITGIVRGGVARGAEVPAGSLADAGAPSLTVLPYDEAEDVVTVRGQGFTPEGKVYLSIIDQMGKQLYEHRWVTASPRATYDAGIRSDFDSTIVVHAPGGELVAKFKGLCGASALIRALDDASERWT